MKVITVSSRALGRRLRVRVHLYDTLAEMRASARSYNGGEFHDSLGITQARTTGDGRAASVLVRLSRERLDLELVVHEVNHAATALYGSGAPDMIDRRAYLNHHNEPLAYLHSTLTARLVDRLRAHGCEL